MRLSGLLLMSGACLIACSSDHNRVPSPSSSSTNPPTAALTSETQNWVLNTGFNPATQNGIPYGGGLSGYICRFIDANGGVHLGSSLSFGNSALCWESSITHSNPNSPTVPLPANFFYLTQATWTAAAGSGNGLTLATLPNNMISYDPVSPRYLCQYSVKSPPSSMPAFIGPLIQNSNGTWQCDISLNVTQSSGVTYSVQVLTQAS